MVKAIPHGWNLIRLGDYIQEVKERKRDQQGFPVLSVTNSHGFVLSDEFFERKMYSQNLRSYKVIRKGQFAYNPSRLMVGSLARLDSREAGLLSPMYVVFTAKPEIEPNFLHVCLTSSRVKSFMKSRIQGTVRELVTYPALSSLPILLPPLSEQHKIADILNSVEKVIEKTRDLVEQIRRFQKAVISRLLFCGIRGGPKAVRKTPLGEIPKDWDIARLGEVCLGGLEYGANVPALDYDPRLPRYVRITDISEDGNLLPQAVSITDDEARDYLLSEGDLLMARSGATVGKSYLYKKSDGRCAYAGYLIRIRPDKTRLLPDFLFHLAHSAYYYTWIKKMIRTGAQPNINAREYARLCLPLPPLEEQSRICAILSAIGRYRDAEKCWLDNLCSLRSVLRCTLLSGIVRVR
jgi:type I restriction enzyme S subunit